MFRLFLVRHGKTEGEENLYFGHTDIPLSKAGFEQAEKLRIRLKPEKLTAIYSSDLSRAQRTAEIISSPHNLSLSPRPELRELNFGLVEGKSFVEMSRLYPEESKTWFAGSDFSAPGGESLKDLRKRVKSFLKLINRTKDTDNLLIVSHKGPLRVMLCLLIGLNLRDYWKLSLAHASITIVDVCKNGAILEVLNDTSHLK